MAKVVFTKETQDFETGEVIKKEIFRKEVANKEQFIRAYVNDIGALAKCSGSEQSLILCSLKYLDYSTNEMILNKERRLEICECGGIKESTFNCSLSRLVRKNILIKKGSGTYILNPKIFFYGRDLDRASVIQATLVYIIKDKI